MQRLANYILLSFWIFCAGIYLFLDVFLDLYTYQDVAQVAWYAAAVAVPLAAYTLYLCRQTAFTKWYYAILSLTITYGIYLFTAYFSALNADLMLSAALRSEQRETLPITKVERVFAGKGGFVHTNVCVQRGNAQINFEGSRSSYYYLKNKKRLTASIGHSYAGNIYAVKLEIATQERWLARWLYLKNWWNRHWWLIAGMALFVLFDAIRDKYFPKFKRILPKIPNKALLILLGIFVTCLILILLAGLVL